MANKSTPSGLESIDRLEEKIKLLVNTLVRVKADQTRSAEENLRLRGEIQALEARITTSEGVGVELSTLREERDLIKNRVSDMLQQLDGLSL